MQSARFENHWPGEVNVNILQQAHLDALLGELKNISISETEKS